MGVIPSKREGDGNEDYPECRNCGKLFNIRIESDDSFNSFYCLDDNGKGCK